MLLGNEISQLVSFLKVRSIISDLTRNDEFYCGDRESPRRIGFLPVPLRIYNCQLFAQGRVTLIVNGGQTGLRQRRINGSESIAPPRLSFRLSTESQIVTEKTAAGKSSLLSAIRKPNIELIIGA